MEIDTMGAPGDRIAVLLVDDDPDLTEVAAEFVEEEAQNMTVSTATAAEAGLDVLAANPIDCVVSDYDMPRTDGLKFLEEVREACGDLPFILFTGKGSEEVASDAISAGVTEYIQKRGGTDQYAILANRIEQVVAGKRSREALDARTQRLETLISNLPGIVYRCVNEPEWPMEFVAGECEEITGYPATALESGEVKWGKEIIHPDDREAMWEQVQAALETDDPFEVTYRIETADGETKWMWERGRAIDADGDRKILEGFITDITPQREREEELRRYERLVNEMNEAACIYNPDGTFDIVNEYLADYYGMSRTELEGRESDLLPQIRENHEGAPFEELLTGERDEVNGELSGEFQDRENFAVSYRLSPLRINGDIEGVVGVTRDVTERKLHERQLRRFERIVEASGDPVYTLDAEGTFTYVNDRLANMTGHDKTDLVGEHVSKILSPADVERGEALIESLVTGSDDRGTIELDIVTADGTSIQSEVHVALLETDGTFEGTVGSVRDITDRKRRERELGRQNERLEEFARIVSHDLRNPLNVAQGRLELAMDEVDNPHLAEAANAHERMRSLVDDLLTLAREGQTVESTAPVNLAASVDACWRTVDTANARLVDDLPKDYEIMADESRLQQLLENLIRNAIDHAGSDVTITVGDTSSGFFFADDGPGIPPQKREQVFEAGYTTAAEGTGFGLNIVKQIAEAHGWEVRVGQSDDGGARFDVIGVEVR